MTEMIRAIGIKKSFVLHHQGGVRLDVLRGLDLTIAQGECVVLTGPSGAGKSTLLRTLYANYRPTAGTILIRHDGRVVDLAAASPRLALAVRQRSIGYVSQFLRVVPRVPALALVAEPLRAKGVAPEAARRRAEMMLARLAIPERLWALAPATFSGGEQQRINIARCLAADYPILLLDEPTASLDADTAALVAGLVEEARERGAAIVATLHDAALRGRLATRLYDMTRTEAIAA